MIGVVIEIDRSRVVGRPHVGDRFYTLNRQRLYVVDVNLRPDGTYREKQRIIGWEGRGRRCAKPRSPRW
jgi:hypothetical protein